jgi:hypothetical protein
VGHFQAPDLLPPQASNTLCTAYSTILSFRTASLGSKTFFSGAEAQRCSSVASCPV